MERGLVGRKVPLKETFDNTIAQQESKSYNQVRDLEMQIEKLQAINKEQERELLKLYRQLNQTDNY